MAWYDKILQPFEGMNIFGAGVSPTLRKMSEYGLLSDPEAIKKAEMQSIGRGLLGTAAKYFATPKNRQLGSFVPYLFESYVEGGMPAAQSPFSQLEKSALDTFKIEDLQRTRQDAILKQKNRDIIKANIDELNARIANGEKVNMTEFYKEKIIPFLSPEEQSKMLLPQQTPKVVGDKLITYDQFGEKVSEETIPLTEIQREELKLKKEKQLLDQRNIERQEKRDQERHEETIKRLDQQLELSRKATIPQGYRETKDGNLEVVPGGPADQKLQAKGDAGRQLDTLLTSLKVYYQDLEDAKGIISTEAGGWDNFKTAWFQSSSAGQTLGRWFGTKNQETRDKIENSKPLILQAIKQATGMSSKQMDSNRELQFYLQAATDPTRSVQANYEAIDRLYELFVEGQWTGATAKENQIPDVNALSSNTMINDINAELERRKGKK